MEKGIEVEGFIHLKILNEKHEEPFKGNLQQLAKVFRSNKNKKQDIYFRRSDGLQVRLNFEGRFYWETQQDGKQKTHITGKY